MTPGSVAIVYVIIAFIVIQIINTKMAKDDWDKAPYYFFGTLIGLPLALIPLLIILATSSHKQCDVAKIVSIGGCNKYANCAIMTDLGIKSWHEGPVLGEKVEVNCQVLWRE